MNYVDIARAQYIGIAVSVLFIVFIVELIRKRHLKESYAILWLFFGVVLLTFSIWRHGLETMSYALGIAYPPALLFIILILGMFVVLIQYSVVITKLSLKLNRLTQEMGIIKAETEVKKTRKPKKKS